jgi:hypothetical protein
MSAAEIKTIQLEGIPGDKKEFWEGTRVKISANVSALDVPSTKGLMRFYPTGRFVELGVEIWSLIDAKIYC